MNDAVPKLPDPATKTPAGPDEVGVEWLAAVKRMLREMSDLKREVDNLRSENSKLRNEAARTAGQASELHAQIRRTQQDCDHYHRIAVAASAAVDQLYSFISNLHQSIPAITPLEDVPDIGAMRKFAPGTDPRGDPAKK